jgi:branched-chain amino acid transport system ATP-binding protein
MLDEPAAGLTAAEVDALRDMLMQLHASLGLTVVVVEHNMRFVMNTCTQIAVLNFGRRIAVGSPQAIREDPHVIEAYLGGVK